MPQTRETKILIKGNDGDTEIVGTLFTLEFDQAELTKRALTRLGLCWLAAIGSIPIIFAHWVLVPGFIIAGPIMAMTAYKTNTMPDQVNGECPVCKDSISIKLEPKDTFPKWTYCPVCNKSIQIVEIESSTAGDSQ